MICQHNIRVRVGALLFEKGRVLLISHKKNDQVYWLLPGGGVDYGEKLPDALKREVFEELSAEIKVGDIALICESIEPKGGRHILNVVFRCSLKTDVLRIGDEPRLNSFQFFQPDELRTLTMFPAINDDILALISGYASGVYRETNWVPL
jgi:ADP-ribose pyrophosphatase YjhB (NUDIX family)